MVQLYAGALLPGLMLAGLYLGYVIIVAKLKPALMPPLTAEERRVPMPAYVGTLSQRGRNALSGLAGAAFAGRGVPRLSAFGQLFVTLIPALVIAAALAYMYRSATAPVAAPATFGYEVGGLIGVPEAEEEEPAGLIGTPEEEEAEARNAAPGGPIAQLAASGKTVLAIDIARRRIRGMESGMSCMRPLTVDLQRRMGRNISGTLISFLPFTLEGMLPAAFEKLAAIDVHVHIEIGPDGYDHLSP